ncbi:MAG TPA: cytochrome c biogenesis protein CcsA [Xanthomonadales bacterium]|nr:cytochrome c biogenesis protein CcsA [Xanthomonadales bacterium]
MSPLFLNTIFPLIVGVLYVAATWTLNRATNTDSVKERNAALGIMAVAVLVHTLLQYQAWIGQPFDHVKVAAVLSLCSLVLVLLWITTLPRKDAVLESGLIAMPIAALANFLVAIFPPGMPAEGSTLGQAPAGTIVHVASSVISFGLLSLAGVYAILVLAIDHSLKKRKLSRLVQSLPPLDKLETLLFQVIQTGFILLTIALVSGLIYVDNLMAQHLVHKTVLSILAWVVFGALILGRWLKGWRGAIAVRLTLAGIGLLLLSYFGTRLVLELILGRSWYS